MPSTVRSWPGITISRMNKIKSEVSEKVDSWAAWHDYSRAANLQRRIVRRVVRLDFY